MLHLLSLVAALLGLLQPTTPGLHRAAFPIQEGRDPMPYVIHSRDDEVVPFAPAERSARALEKLGRPIRFEALQDIGHYDMGGYVESLRRAGRWVADRWKQ